MIPSDPELPLLLDQVYPLHSVVRIDYFLPGCPPSAENIWMFLSQLLSGYEPMLVNETVHFD
jgi:NAD-reducing hydrogenase small subunit